jgi:hypothetical protein
MLRQPHHCIGVPPQYQAFVQRAGLQNRLAQEDSKVHPAIGLRNTGKLDHIGQLTDNCMLRQSNRNISANRSHNPKQMQYLNCVPLSPSVPLRLFSRLSTSLASFAHSSSNRWSCSCSAAFALPQKAAGVERHRSFPHSWQNGAVEFPARARQTRVKLPAFVMTHLLTEYERQADD